MKKILINIYYFLRFLFGMCFVFSILGILFTGLTMQGVHYGIAIGMFVTVMYYLTKER